MCLIAFRVTLLACALGVLGHLFHALPLLWLSFALVVIAVAALIADLLGVTP